jgi:hypothetical protein
MGALVTHWLHIGGVDEKGRRVTSDVFLLNLGGLGMADLQKEQEHDEGAKRHCYDHDAQYLNGVRTECGGRDIGHGAQFLKLRLPSEWHGRRKKAPAARGHRGLSSRCSKKNLPCDREPTSLASEMLSPGGNRSNFSERLRSSRCARCLAHARRNSSLNGITSNRACARLGPTGSRARVVEGFTVGTRWSPQPLFGSRAPRLDLVSSHRNIIHPTEAKGRLVDASGCL